MPYSEKNQYYHVTKDLNYEMDQCASIQKALSFYSKVMEVKNEGVLYEKFRHVAPLGKDVRVFKLAPRYEKDGFHEKFYYITGVKNIFPVDYNFQIEKPHL